MSHPGTRLAIAAAILATSLAVIAGFGTFAGDRHDDNARLASLQQIELPGDGLPLYQALLREIPDVVAEVPCACCSQSLEFCYTGGCPPG